jgi:bifunctional DNA-binding transcriptional regulator/antitoxin component of YhaV-PrlF toxin-antitoxin module
MARDTHITAELHLIKATGEEYTRVTIPKPLREALAIEQNTYLGMRTLGPCLIITKLRDVSPDAAPIEMAKQIERALKAWAKSKP